MVDDKLAAAITAGALGIIVLLFGGNVFPLDASSNLKLLLLLLLFIFEFFFLTNSSALLISSNVTPCVERRVSRTRLACALRWVSLSSSRTGGTKDLRIGVVVVAVDGVVVVLPVVVIDVVESAVVGVLVVYAAVIDVDDVFVEMVFSSCSKL